MAWLTAFVSLALAAVAAMAPDVGSVVLDRVVAVVGDEIVLLSQLEQETERSVRWAEARAQPPNASPKQLADKRREVRAQVLDDLVDNVLVQKEAERFQITATEEDVERYLGQLAAANGYATIDALRKDVEASGEYGNWGEYKQDLREQIVVFKTVGTLAAPTVTDAQVRAYYRKMTKDEGATVEVDRFDFVPTSGNSKARDAAFAQAQTVTRRLRGGEAAAKIAEAIKYEADVRFSVGRGDVAPIIEDALFSAKKGQVVGPLDAGQGYVVLRVIDHRAAAALGFEEAKDRIHEHLMNEATLKAERAFKQSLRAKAHVDLRL